MQITLSASILNKLLPTYNYYIMAQKIKTIKAENARVYFTVTHKQFTNNKIPARVYFDRLYRLRSIIAANSTLYKILNDILKIPNKQQRMSMDRNNRRTLLGKYELICQMEELNNALLYSTNRITISDKDNLPSVPHIHDYDNNRKIDIYTGSCTDGSYLSDEELVSIWNDEAIIKKIMKNRKVLETL